MQRYGSRAVIFVGVWRCEPGADSKELEGGGATGEALACCAFLALMDLILSRSQALTDQVVDRVGTPWGEVLSLNTDALLFSLPKSCPKRKGFAVF